MPIFWYWSVKRCLLYLSGTTTVNHCGHIPVKAHKKIYTLFQPSLHSWATLVSSLLSVICSSSNFWSFLREFLQTHPKMMTNMETRRMNMQTLTTTAIMTTIMLVPSSSSNLIFPTVVIWLPNLTFGRT